MPPSDPTTPTDAEPWFWGIVLATVLLGAALVVLLSIAELA